MTLTASKSLIARHAMSNQPIITESEISLLNQVRQLKTIGMINDEQILQASGLNRDDLVGLDELMGRLSKAA
jgi:N-acetylglucosamine-6-phosphate deacetylase